MPPPWPTLPGHRCKPHLLDLPCDVAPKGRGAVGARSRWTFVFRAVKQWKVRHLRWSLCRAVKFARLTSCRPPSSALLSHAVLNIVSGTNHGVTAVLARLIQWVGAEAGWEVACEVSVPLWVQSPSKALPLPARWRRTPNRCPFGHCWMRDRHSLRSHASGRIGCIAGHGCEARHHCRESSVSCRGTAQVHC